MSDLIVTDQDVNSSEKTISWDDFLEAANSDDGLDIDGDLYLDVHGLEQYIYEAVMDSMPAAKYFSLDQTVPDFVDFNNVLDWSDTPDVAEESYGRQKQTATRDTSNMDDRSSRETEESFINTIQSDREFDTDPNIKYPEKDTDGTPNEEFDDSAYSQKQARIILFGSSKGGTGKTFTCLISAYRYAMMNPDKRVAVSDFDIIDGQVGITVHKITPTMLDYYKNYKFGKDDFETMERFKTKSDNFPPNLDFYLAPRDIYIDDDGFWDSIFINLIENYDTIFFDSGIDYMNYKPISTLYKIADKIVLVSTTSIKSVSSVSKQIKRLKGEISNPVFSAEDDIGRKLNLVITQAGKTDEMNSRVFATFQPRIKIVGVFGVLTPEIQKAEYYGDWAIFDKNTKFNETIDKVVE